MNADVAVDDRLSVLALRVAQQVDSKLLGRDFDGSVLENFGRQLALTTGVSEPNPATSFFSDPLTTEAFAHAVAESSKQAVSDISELTEAIRKIIGTIGEPVRSEDLAQIKQFCLALHKSMMAQDLPSLQEGDNPLDDELGFFR
jgi:hypothetical protein